MSLQIPSSPPTVWRSRSLGRWAKGGDFVAIIHIVLRGRFVIAFFAYHRAQILQRSSPFPRATSAAVIRGRGVHAALGCGCARPCRKPRGRFPLHFPASVILISRFSSPCLAFLDFLISRIVISAFHRRPASSVLRPASPHPVFCRAILRFHIAVSCVSNLVYLSSHPRDHIANISSFGFRVVPAASRPSRFSRPSRMSPRSLSQLAVAIFAAVAHCSQEAVAKFLAPKICSDLNLTPKNTLR